MMLKTNFHSRFTLVVFSLVLCLSQQGLAQKKAIKPSQKTADTFVGNCLQSLKIKDSLSFKSLFLADTLSNLEQDTRQMLQNKLIYANYRELQQKLGTYLDTANLRLANCRLLSMQYKEPKSKKKIYVYHLQSALQTNANTSVQLDLPCLFQQQKFFLISAIAINEIVQSNE